MSFAGPEGERANGLKCTRGRRGPRGLKVNEQTSSLQRRLFLAEIPRLSENRKVVIGHVTEQEDGMSQGWGTVSTPRLRVKIHVVKVLMHQRSCHVLGQHVGGVVRTWGLQEIEISSFDPVLYPQVGHG